MNEYVRIARVRMSKDYNKSKSRGMIVKVRIRKEC